MTRKAVLDSSILVSAFLKSNSPPGLLLGLARQGVYSLHLLPPILAETTKVLLRPKLLGRRDYSPEEVAEFEVALHQAATIELHLPALAGAVPLDPKDDVIVATAVAARASYLVTGDRRHLLVLGEYQGIQILTPRAFLDQCTAK